MNRIILILALSIFIVSCGSRKKSARNVDTRIKKTDIRSIPKKEKEIVTEPKTITKAPVIKSTDDYIAFYKDIAIAEMKQYGIPASITLAQGILESGSGRGRLAVKANNHFGIKCHDWEGAKIFHDDDRAQECFRKYRDANTSFRDHSEFLANRKRYAKLFELDKDDYKGWAKELRKAGYATDRKYPEKLISLIERYQLYKFDDKASKRHRKAKKEYIIATYTVVKGDTLYSISKKHNISVKELQSLNNLNGTELNVGQVLNVLSKEGN
ncbi:glucosaminidase domain-containing protein [Flavobacteriaceae bacterium S0825]|uniref:glucosaminidase domain-containing protein n=1 Tax=Gaetbulibacter sp. S0825 TaxID=2720084 RepID=UPI00142F728F|nr:glucosaminidase domain-containing protein [Gaetbulibacter sp. S0825]MCK0107682.1 glucosaminidase domain-containing protein [Flavobacteriaceae bacterium S0825]NIX63318.1 LysM peptidoglycan-binding domain-containing protein [Gaetbulibacter sp. S0825]